MAWMLACAKGLEESGEAHASRDRRFLEMNDAWRESFRLTRVAPPLFVSLAGLR